MLYSYSQCIEMFGTDRKLKQALERKKIFKIENVFIQVQNILQN